MTRPTPLPTATSSFDSDSLYYSLHAGASYAKPLTDKATLDLSAKLLWTRQESDDVTVYQDAVHFDKADSLRTRIGPVTPTH